MSTDAGAPDHPPLSPEEAFAILGNETRLAILRTLAEAGGSLSFTELRDRVGLQQGTQFNYHLEKVVGQFVAKTEAGYRLRRPGERVVQAVFSGAVTADPVRGPEPLDDWQCPYCGGDVVVRFEAEELKRYCTSCAGYSGRRPSPESAHVDRGYLGSLSVPPAAVEGRTPDNLLRAAFTWGYAQWLMAANGVCPRCAASFETSVSVCEDHASAEEFCPTCEMRQAVQFRGHCDNCYFELGSVMSMYLAGSTEMLAFMSTHGINPVADPWDWGWEYDEEVLSVDPFEARFTFELEGETLTLAVDDDLTVSRVDSNESF